MAGLEEAPEEGTVEDGKEEEEGGAGGMGVISFAQKGLLIEYSVSNLHICTVLYVSMYVIPCVQEPYDRKTAKRALFARLTKCESDMRIIMRLEKTFPTVYIRSTAARRGFRFFRLKPNVLRPRRAVNATFYVHHVAVNATFYVHVAANVRASFHTFSSCQL